MTPIGPTMLDAEYWRSHRCIWCGGSGLFVHRMTHTSLGCDRCDAYWEPAFVGRWLYDVLRAMLGLAP